MLAYAEHLAETCTCGQPINESMDPANAGDPGDPGRYVVPPPRRCYACTALGHAFEAYRENPIPSALRFRAELVARA